MQQAPTTLNGESSLNWIAQLPPAVEAEVRAAMKLKVFPAGEAIYRYQEEADATYQVQSGSVQTSNVTAEGKEILLHIMQIGECFGEIGLIEGSRRAHTAAAREDTELAVLSKADFNALRRRHWEINEALLKMQCTRLRMVFMFIEDSALRPLRQRLARRLVLMATMMGSKQGEQIIIKLALSQEELGKMLGASRQSVNKELSYLEKHNIVAKTRDGIAIVDPAALNALT
ncbi:MAG: Crp/Fnr family transcriptional regulator [Cellvibrionaceae bacterium]|nr:Crp/Fnr family transcriptional regulator [Cellvibrionaceae bacterium]MCV6624726.1 Crp/Fnr family transcriptional regulator [Cellvibrionaceae bacterium]